MNKPSLLVNNNKPSSILRDQLEFNKSLIQEQGALIETFDWSNSNTEMVRVIIFVREILLNNCG